MHQQNVQLVKVGYEEILEAILAHVTGLLVVTVTNNGHNAQVGAFSTNAVINTTRAAPASLIAKIRIYKNVNCNSFITKLDSKMVLLQVLQTSMRFKRSLWWRVNLMVRFLVTLRLIAGATI